MEQEIAVIVPPMLEFFAGSIVAVDHGVKTLVKRPGILWLLAFWSRGVLNKHLGAFDEVLCDFRYHRSHHNIREIARKAEELVTLNHQYGEGWLIAGEVASFVEEGVPNVLCLQPFGCIANHVVAKGVQKRIKERYPEVNMIFLDADDALSPDAAERAANAFLANPEVSKVQYRMEVLDSSGQRFLPVR